MTAAAPFSRPASRLEEYHAAWGLYWLRIAVIYPEHAPACHWNTFMQAMQCMAEEAIR